MSVNILGTWYGIEVKQYDQDPEFKKQEINGYCDGVEKRIVICDMKTLPNFETVPEDACKVLYKETLRHEILHAFFRESGLWASACQSPCAWSMNEEMIDWFAIQGPKIIEAWREADAL